MTALVFLVALNMQGRAEDGIFKIHDGRYWDPDGKEFIPKGANIQGPNQCWEGHPVDHLDDYADCWQFNFARIYGRLNKRSCTWPGHTVEELYQTIDEFTKRKIVCMPELHDKTGGYFEGSMLSRAIDYWEDIATRSKDNPYVWINCMNEPGSSSPSKSRWLACHRAMIKAIRATGFPNPIICDAEYWGQDGGGPRKSTLLKYGNEVKEIDGKIDENIGFDTHVYEQFRGMQTSHFREYFKKFHDKGMAIMVGEYGRTRETSINTWPMTRAMMPAAQELGVGRVVWSWFGGDNHKLVEGYLDPNTSEKVGWRGWTQDDCENPTNLTNLGSLVWQDNHRVEKDVWLPGYPKDRVNAGMQPRPLYSSCASDVNGIFRGGNAEDTTP
jgi:mannan endo-1,4-beta-mannosidase